ncbi:Aste57867_10200 [Aphanomyces stellatus]|uniref:Aste57867_10200 protein n=1 Tax=Aphanomyces stellatus TaxID=120398 RepID=A0A485KQR4_9STRA|nr:hypothetical protein As57867_010161 [Aphanomyces stellatus]VFT87076.1 Aste57867_10200 [Aphanomyces stellatus]
METMLDVALEAHQANITALRERLFDAMEPCYDDIWLLRFLLSNGSVDAAEDPALFTIQWRTDRAHRPSRERLFLDCDRLTRERRQLVKMLVVLDFHHFSLVRGHDTRFGRLNGATSKISEKMFPQLLGRTIFLHTPRVFPWMFKFMKLLLSARTVEKMVFCTGGPTSFVTTCPFVRTALAADAVPTFLGGTCTCRPGACVAGVPNSQTAPIDSVDDDGLLRVTLAARAAQVIEYPVWAGMLVRHCGGWQGGGCPRARRRRRRQGHHQGTRAVMQATGTWTIPCDGMLQFQLTNCHVRWRSRSVKFRIDSQSN